MCQKAKTFHYFCFVPNFHTICLTQLSTELKHGDITKPIQFVDRFVSAWLFSAFFFLGMYVNYFICRYVTLSIIQRLLCESTKNKFSAISCMKFFWILILTFMLKSVDHFQKWAPFYSISWSFLEMGPLLNYKMMIFRGGTPT